VEQGHAQQKEAEGNIAKPNNQEAAQNQGQALKEFEIARRKLQELRNQLREEEMIHLLANLQARCEKMLAMQLRVLEGTENVFKAAQATADKKPGRQQQQDALKLSAAE